MLPENVLAFPRDLRPRPGKDNPLANKAVSVVMRRNPMEADALNPNNIQHAVWFSLNTQCSVMETALDRLQSIYGHEIRYEIDEHEKSFFIFFMEGDISPEEMVRLLTSAGINAAIQKTRRVRNAIVS